MIRTNKIFRRRTKNYRDWNKIPDITGFITTPEFNRSTKISFDAKTKEITKSLAIKCQVDTTFDLAEKNG